MPEFVGPLGANSRHSRIASQCLLMQAKRPSIHSHCPDWRGTATGRNKPLPVAPEFCNFTGCRMGWRHCGSPPARGCKSSSSVNFDAPAIIGWYEYPCLTRASESQTSASGYVRWRACEPPPSSSRLETPVAPSSPRYASAPIAHLLSVTHSPTLSPAPYISSAIRRGTPAMCSKITFTSSRVNTTGTRWRRCTRLSPASSPNGICRTESTETPAHLAPESESKRKHGARPPSN